MFRRPALTRATSAVSGCQFRFNAGNSLPPESAVQWYTKTWGHMTKDGQGVSASVASPVDFAEIRRQLQAFSSGKQTGGQRFLPTEVTQHLWRSYNQLEAANDKPGQIAFLGLLVEVGVDTDAVRRNIATLNELLGTPDAVDMSKVLTQLDKATTKMTSLHSKWLQETITVPSGTQQLLDFRHSLLDLEAWAKKENSASMGTDLRKVQAVLSTATSQLRDWFHVAWLDMRPLSWNSTSPAVIEQVMRHDAVHRMRPGALRHALYRMEPTPNRHMFAFFHPTIPHMPLVTVQVALTRGIAGSVDEILFRERQEDTPGFSTPRVDEADTTPNAAIFYSINATQEGLRGIDLGKFLIQKAVHYLQNEMPATEQRRAGSSGESPITTFSTLSPIPGYVSWLEGLLRAADQEVKKGGVDEKLAALRQAFSCPTSDPRQIILETDNQSESKIAVMSEVDLLTSALRVLVGAAKSEDGGPLRVQLCDGSTENCLKPILLRSAALYLACAKRRGKILDPVGNFHVKNGATMYRINWAANLTPNGRKQSLCMMVNYLYEVETATKRSLVESNATQYEMNGTVALGDQVKVLLQVKG